MFIEPKTNFHGFKETPLHLLIKAKQETPTTVPPDTPPSDFESKVSLTTGIWIFPILPHEELDLPGHVLIVNRLGPLVVDAAAELRKTATIPVCDKPKEY